MSGSSKAHNILYNAPYLLLSLAILFWAGNFILGRAVRAEIPPVGLAFWRWAVASFFLWPFAWRHLRRDWPKIRAHLPIILLLSALGVGSFNTLVYTGLQFTVALNAFLLQSLMPILVVILSWAFFAERISLKQAAGILISLGGALAIIFEGKLATLLAFRLNPGDALVSLAVLFYAGYTAFLRKRPALHPFSFLLITFIYGTLMILPFYLWEMLAGRFVSLNAPTLFSILYVAIFPSILSYLFYNRGVDLVGANRAGLFAHLMPIFGSILSVLILGEVFRLYHAVGMALILGGIVLTTRPNPRARTVPADAPS